MKVRKAKHLLRNIGLAALAALSLRPAALLTAAPVFEGRIEALLRRGGEKQTLLYTAGARQLRIELSETNRPHARDIVDRQTGAVTLLFPHNRSFVRFKRAAAVPSPDTSGKSVPPGRALQGVSPSSGAALSGSSAGIEASKLPGAPGVPRMPQPPSGLSKAIGPQPGGDAITAGMLATVPISMKSAEELELQATGRTTNLLGYSCQQFQVTQCGEVMEIWATDQLLPFQEYLANQPSRFGPKLLEDRWPELLNVRQLFPLLAILSVDHGSERLRFEVKAITQEKIADPEGRVFQPPPEYRQVEPRPF